MDEELSFDDQLLSDAKKGAARIEESEDFSNERRSKSSRISTNERTTRYAILGCNQWNYNLER